LRVESRTERLIAAREKIYKKKLFSPAVNFLFSTLKRDKKMAFAFEKLIVYQKAVDFADKICTATSQFPNGYYFLRDQLNRASLSISANIAEGGLLVRSNNLWNTLLSTRIELENTKNKLIIVKPMISGLAVF
jgi:four helix bundle protein